MKENMNDKKKLTGIMMELFEDLLEVDDLETALAGMLEILVRVMKCEGGVLWLLDRNTERLVPVFHIAPVDLSNSSIELGRNVESYVVQTGEAVLYHSGAADDRFFGTILDEFGFPVSSMLCVGLNNLQEIAGCLQLVNKKDGSLFTEDELKICKRTAALAALTIDEKGLTVNAGEKKEVLISLRGVIKDYPSGEGTVRVLKGIDLDVYKGEFLVVLGESGCGKSTMVNIIGGMDNLTEGSLIIEGKDFSHPTEHMLTQFRRDSMGFVFQSYNLMPNLTAQENVQYIADIAPDPMPAEEAIRMVGLTERADHYPAALSGGQQQRVSIARAIVKRPKIIFADEPTAALDYQTSIEVLSVFEEIMKNRGTTVMMITHNPEIAKMANRVAKIKDGRISSIKVNIHPLHATELQW